MDLRVYLLAFFIFFAHYSKFVNAECLAQHFNLTQLEIWNPWKSVANVSGQLGTFSFSLCESVTDSDCSSSSICWKDGTKAVNIGSTQETLVPIPSDQSGGFSLNYTGDACEDGGMWFTSIEFKCGVSLGSPEFLSRSGCFLAFEWHTTLACTTQLAKGEVPCYVIDDNNRKRDLSPLIKQTGAYLVDSDDDRDLYINVCRDITPGTTDSTSDCPTNSSACLVQEGEDVKVGEVLSALRIVGDNLQLNYKTQVVPSGCSGFQPSTKITFVCPREGGRFGGSKDPVLLTDTNCHFIIEWQTEYACEVDMYTSNGDCRFTYDNDGIDIDLSPLKGKSFTAADSDENGFNYYLSVCSSLKDAEVPCGESGGAAVCQEKKSQSTERHSTGESEGFNLRYADGEVTLVYSGGEVCHHNHFQRTSVISFKCNKTAGDGKPTFVSEAHCMYFFVWETQHVCLERSQDTTCRVSRGSQRFDLSSLVRDRGTNWVALNGLHDHEDSDDGVYYINICADLLDDSSTENCPPGSSSCFVDHDNNGHSLGKFTESPVYDEGDIVLTYVDGDEIGSCKKKTIIRFICTPGDMESAPSLVRKLDHSCEYEFQWRTAAACPLGRRTGENCQVFDEDAGFTFDLSPLTKSGANYEVNFHEYTYSLNVCDNVTDTSCNSEDTPNPGACQKRKDSNDHFTLGLANSTLEYYDGVLKLSYMMGSTYNVQDKVVHRQADIVFLCDINTDSDIEFVAEADHVYTFKFHTKYACPQPPVECIITDEKLHKQYDLSSLSKALDEDNWSYVDSGDTTRKYYINVCRPVNPLPFCGPFAAACQTTFDGDEEIPGIKNLGVPSSPPTVESEGNLAITYVNGSLCSNGQRNIQTRIHFRCRKGELASSPYLLDELDEGCLFSFLWETEAACPITTSKGDGCTVEDTNSGYTFNLNSLTVDAFYEPKKESEDLPSTRINICQGMADNQCPKIGDKQAGACVNDGQKWVSLGVANSDLTYSDDGLLTLTYLGDDIEGSSGRQRKAVITFTCRHDISVTTKLPETASCHGTEECHFNFETPLACLPESVDCLVSDSAGNQYDLSSLAKEDGNWEAVDTRDGQEHISYHINVCKPLYSLDPQISSCHGGPISACRTDSAKNTATNLGYVQAMPLAADDGTLTIRYVGGDVCDSDGSVLTSTRINFECSDTPGSPIFQSVSEFCEYVFTWQTPAACPLKRVTGKDCRVSVDELSYQFDLSSLYNSEEDYEVTASGYKYTMNVCNALVSPTDNCEVDNVGGCQQSLDGSSTYLAGIVNGDLVYDSGILKLNYTGGAPCHKQVYERSTAINFVCDDSLSDNGRPEFIKETDDCTYQFEWATPLACPPFPQVECSFRDDRGQFDLAPLLNVDDNFEVSSDGANEAFYLTVCRSLRNGPGKKGSSCPTNAAACLETAAEGGEKQYINLGQVNTGPTREGDHLVLRYDSGDPCPSGDGKRSTVIRFSCDHNEVGSLPQFQYAEDDCTYYFMWMTKLACQISHEDKTSQSCTVSNPITGFQFDLKVLQSVKTVNIFGHDQHVYNISICTALTDTPCQGDSIGACQTQRDVASPRYFVTGKFNKDVFFDDGVLSLQYSNGTPCHNNNFRRRTIINFVCPHEEDTLGEPVFVSETEDCAYYFSWHTSAACEEFIQCSVINGTETIDLSPLVQKRGYYSVKTLVDGQGLTYINLCRPLNPIQGMLCPPNAAVCQIGTDNHPKSLGRIDSGPKIGEDGNVFINYTNGGNCAEDASKKVSSVIKFKCQTGEEKGQPILISYDDCIYTFEWSTYVVCPPATATKGEHCEYLNDVMEYLFDLNSLAQKTYNMDSEDGQIRLQMCGSVAAADSSQCNGAAVCLKRDGSSEVSLGQYSSQEFSFEGGILKVSYSDGSSCPHDENEKRETVILLRCSESKQQEKPRFFTADHDYCHVTLQWNTPIACPPQTMPCTVTDGKDKLFDLQALSQITGSWIVQTEDKTKYFINVCKPALNSPSECPNDASICREEPTKDIETLGRIYTQNLEYDGNGVITLSYSEGIVNTCGKGIASREGFRSEVKIKFKCSNKVGSPAFESEIKDGDTCVVSFLWESKVACQVQKDPVELKDGTVTDPETGVVLDLQPLLEGEKPDGSWLVENDDRSAITNSLDQYQYLIQLNDNDMDGGQECSTAAICQTKSDKRFFRNIGLRSERKYFVEDDTLEMVTRNPGSCRKDNSDVLSTVIFECDRAKSTGRPEFLYESGNCQYFFLWQTSRVCELIPNKQGDGGGGGAGGGGGDGTDATKAQKGSFGRVVLVFSVVILICILVIVFHKRERRSAIYVKIRRCFPGAYSNVPTYSYSQLSNGDRVDSTGEETRGLFDSDGEDEEILKETSPNLLEYKDDSDEDLLIDSRV